VPVRRRVLSGFGKCPYVMSGVLLGEMSCAPTAIESYMQRMATGDESLQGSAPVVQIKPRLLVIDDNADTRFLVSKTLLRKFPHAIVSECVTVEAATAI
jgi:hypothetical protein